MRKIGLLLLLSFLISCGINKKDLMGKYSYQGKETIDSLTIKEKIYIHKIYNKKSELMYEGISRWNLDGNDRITLFDFYNNEDNLLAEPLSKEDAKNFLMIASFPFYKNGKSIIIEANSDDGFLYKKQNK